MTHAVYERALVAGARAPEDLRLLEFLHRMRPRIDLLEPSDRVLLDLIPTGLRTHREVARLLGIDAGTISRRLRQVLKRLNDPLVGVLLDRNCALPAEARQIGIEHFLMGLTATAIADKHQMHRRRVREQLSYMRGFVGGTVAGRR